VGVQFVDVEGVASLVHVGVVVALGLGIAVDLNSLSAVALLRVQLASVYTVTNVNRLDEKCLVVAASGVRGMSGHACSLLAHHGLAGGVESEVGLSHELLIERRVDAAIGVEVAGVIHVLLLLSSAILALSAIAFEKLGENGLLLLVHVLPVVPVTAILDLKSFTLNGVVELSLTLSSSVLGVLVISTLVVVVVSSAGASSAGVVSG